MAKYSFLVRLMLRRNAGAKWTDTQSTGLRLRWCLAFSLTNSKQLSRKVSPLDHPLLSLHELYRKLWNNQLGLGAWYLGIASLTWRWLNKHLVFWSLTVDFYMWYRYIYMHNNANWHHELEKKVLLMWTSLISVLDY